MSLVDVKCKNCNRLLGKFVVCIGAIKCPRCYKIFEYHLYSNITMSNSHDPSETKSKLEERNKRH